MAARQTFGGRAVSAQPLLVHVHARVRMRMRECVRTGAAPSLGTLVRSWEDHIQPLVCDLGLILVSFPDVMATLACGCNAAPEQQQQQQARAWLSLTAGVASYCIHTGLPSWAALLRELLGAAAASGPGHPAAAALPDGAHVPHTLVGWAGLLPLPSR